MRKNLYLFILLMIICSITTLATAQVTKVVIRGVVTAAIDKLPLPGAHVMLLNKDGRVVGNAIADMDGNYSMRVETRAGDNLVVSYTGMKKATIPVKGRMTINVVMQDETVMLEGATIVASKKTSNGMMDINERDLTTAMGKVSMADLEDGMTAPSVEDALQGLYRRFGYCQPVRATGGRNVSPHSWYHFYDGVFTTAYCSRRVSL